MVHNQSSHSWLGRFCVQLMRIKPELNVIVAVKHAVATQPYAADLEPERAARPHISSPSRWSLIMIRISGHDQ